MSTNSTRINPRLKIAIATVIAYLFFFVLISLSLAVATINLQGGISNYGLSVSLIVFASLCIALILVLPLIQASRI